MLGDERRSLFDNGIDFGAGIGFAQVEEHARNLGKQGSAAVKGHDHIVKRRRLSIVNNSLDLGILLLYASLDCRHIVLNAYLLERRNAVRCIPLLEEGIGTCASCHSQYSCCNAYCLFHILLWL